MFHDVNLLDFAPLFQLINLQWGETPTDFLKKNCANPHLSMSCFLVISHIIVLQASSSSISLQRRQNCGYCVNYYSSYLGPLSPNHVGLIGTTPTLSSNPIQHQCIKQVKLMFTFSVKECSFWKCSRSLYSSSILYTMTSLPRGYLLCSLQEFRFTLNVQRAMI